MNSSLSFSDISTRTRYSTYVLCIIITIIVASVLTPLPRAQLETNSNCAPPQHYGTTQHTSKQHNKHNMYYSKPN